MEKVTVSAVALRQLLVAFNGNQHQIAEIYALSQSNHFTDNPVRILTDEFNAAIDAEKGE